MQQSRISPARPQPVHVELSPQEFEYVRALVLVAWQKGFTSTTSERFLLLGLEAKLNQIANELAETSTRNGATVEEKAAAPEAAP